MNELWITLQLPPSELNPNGRTHWRAKMKAKADYRYHVAEESQVAAARLDNHSWLPLSEAVIAVGYFHPTNAFKDPDNILASLKTAFDGLVDGGILTDDRDVTYPPVLRYKDKENPRVELLITEAKGG